MVFSKRNMFAILFCFCFGFCRSRDTITINQTLQGSETILSEGNKFKMGFFSPENTSKYYVGIMYNNPLKAVIWVANGDKSMNDLRGTIKISEDGNLVVLDGQKTTIWSSNFSDSQSNTTAAQLLDTGNLVVKDGSTGRVLWESFRNPSDSLVRTMKLGTKELRSWRSPSDPFAGSFSLGILPLNIPQVAIWNNSEIYWRTGPWNKQIFIGVSNMDSYYNNGFDITTDNEGSKIYLSFNYLNQSEILYYRLSSHGSLLQMYWDQEKEEWEVAWESHASECDEYGKCGPFGICNPSGVQICSCLQGFIPKKEVEWSKGNWSSGCIRKEDLQCDRNNSNVNKGKEDGFLKLQKVKVPDFFTWVPLNEDICETECLRNCSCFAYSFYTGIGCMHWTGSLIDLQQFSMGGADLYIRLAYSELDLKKESKGNNKAIIATTLTISSLAIAICAYFGWGWLAKHRGKKQKRVIRLGTQTSSQNMLGEDASQVKLEELPVFSFEIVANATENFDPHNKLGEGGFGPVYKGKLEDGQEVAVKRLSKYSGQGQNEFMNEVVVISKLQHRNLVRLLGCCIERGEKILIYEFMPNGSLDALLFVDHHNEEFLDWTKRFMIIEGIGRGLLYLHRDSRLRIVHRDLKASNILLDEQLNPKISDFGLARIFGGNQHQANTERVVGTYGYMAPEYAMDGRFSEKSDVNSFRILLLEIVSGRKNSGFYHDEFAISLLAHAWKMWNEEKMEEVVDPRIYDLRFKTNVKRCVHVGFLCVQEYPEDRPNVSTVLSMLSSEIAELPNPKQPAFTGKQSCLDIDSAKQSKFSVNSTTITVIEGR